MTTKHTPTPWRVYEDKSTHSWWIALEEGVEHTCASDVAVCFIQCFIDNGDGVPEANAKHIVHCVNMHDKLVAENKDLKERLDNFSDRIFELIKEDKAKSQ